MEGGSTPVWPAAAKESEQRPAVVEVANPDIVWKSSRNWQTSSDTLSMVWVQDPVEEGV